MVALGICKGVGGCIGLWHCYQIAAFIFRDYAYAYSPICFRDRLTRTNSFYKQNDESL